MMFGEIMCGRYKICFRMWKNEEEDVLGLRREIFGRKNVF
jgi:hypothetical protein